jgi:dienelactone hydrolase
MKRRSLLNILFLFPGILLAQKPALDLNSYKKWEEIMSPNISNDGKYATYGVGTSSRTDTKVNFCIVKSIHGNWQEKLPSVGVVTFTADSRFGIFKKSLDTLGLITLGGSIRYFPNVGSFSIPRETAGWLICQSSKQSGELNISNLYTGEQNVLKDVNSYQLMESGRSCKLLLQVKTLAKQVSLRWYDLKTRETTTIWEGENLRSITVSHYSEDLAFITGPTDKGVVWYCQSGMPAAKELLTNLPKQTDRNMKIAGLVGFNNRGTHLYLNITGKNPVRNPNPSAGNVEVWGYEDPKLQSEQQFHEQNISRNFLCVLDIRTGQNIRLEKDGENIAAINRIVSWNYNDDQLLLVKDAEGSLSEYKWNKLSQSAIYLIKTGDGTKTLINSGFPGVTNGSYQLSPAGKYVLWLDQTTGCYRTYTVANGKVNNITSGASATWAVKRYVTSWYPFGHVKWLKNDMSVIAYGDYDIFQLFPEGQHPPICITNYYGRKHHIVLRPINDDDLQNQGKKIILNAFDQTNMDEGFFELGTLKKQDPKRLTMQPYMFTDIATQAADFNPVGVLKARDTEVYVVQRMSASASPNYFVTSDFEQFKPITEIYPETTFNWLTTELVKWKTPDGKLCNGILYKPENFDRKRKYPIIFYYYEELSTGIHGYRAPEGNFGATLDIPLFVSQGYLVFLPDIHYTLGYPGRSAYNSVVSAALYLSQKPYVDTKHMGIQGHSFGGYETNYIVSHSHLFAAACAASGVSDCVMEYNTIRDLGDGSPHQGVYETGRWRTGATLWERPDLYIENSPIFKADQVTTPLLLMADKLDNDIRWTNGIEFFTALRRLQKKVWLLNYPEEGHIIHDPAAVLDYHTRMKQFFDHYLKGLPAPKWMVEGIPAVNKGIDDGLGLEPAGMEPPDGPLEIKKQTQRQIK